MDIAYEAPYPSYVAVAIPVKQVVQIALALVHEQVADVPCLFHPAAAIIPQVDDQALTPWETRLFSAASNSFSASPAKAYIAM